MFKHYLLSAFRSFYWNKKSFVINLVGLTTGLACTIFIFLWVNDELKMDTFHRYDERLFQVMEHQEYIGELMTTSSTPGVLADALQEEIPEIEYAATLTWVSPATLTISENKNFKAEGFHVGREFFNIFSYNLISGSADEVLRDIKSIVICESLAIKLFGSVDSSIGKQIQVQHNKTFLVSGVFEDVPINSTFQFEYVLSFEDYIEENDWVLEWGNNGPRTVVLLKEGTDLQAVNAKITYFVANKNTESNVTLFITKYSDIYLFGSYKNGVQSGGRIEYVRLFSIIAIFILLIACINFMNLSTARASKKAYEVGIRKALGANRRSLFWQYIGESTSISLISLILAIVVVALLLPVFNDVTDKQIALDFSPIHIVNFLSITIITGLLAGSYPAIYLSQFEAVKVLKGDIRATSGELWARRGLVVFQFTLSIILIVAVIIVYNQIEYVQTKNLGYNKDNIVYFYQEGKVDDDTEIFMHELRQLPGVVDVSSLGHNLLGRQNNTSGLSWEGKNPDDKILFENIRIGHGLLKMLDIQLKEGRFFSKEFSTDTSKIIFNETGIKAMGLENPIGKNIKLWDIYDREIIGVIKDFHFQSLHKQVEPAFFTLQPESTWVIMVRIDSKGITETLKGIEEFYASFNPGFILDYNFLDKDYSKLYSAEQRVATLSRSFAGFAILISCLGLLGLAAFTAERKVKEIGIRKVLGASVFDIVLLLTKDFSKLILLSIILAMPIAYYISSKWLEDFAYRIDLSAWYFIAAGLIALFVALFTVGTQALRAANANPTDSLRNNE